MLFEWFYEMLVRLNYVIFSVFLLIYISWRYFKQRKSGLRYLALSSIFLILSTTVQMIGSQKSIYGIPTNLTLKRVIELGGLALFACFTITAVIGVRKMSEA
jgi:hypothetical protein